MTPEQIDDIINWSHWGHLESFIWWIHRTPTGQSYSLNWDVKDGHPNVTYRPNFMGHSTILELPRNWIFI